MKKLKKIISTHYLPVIFLLFYFSITSYKLITHPTPFYDWDEAIYVEVGKEMVEKRSLVPLWQGKAWLEKPPLVPFLYGLILKLPIQPEISTRIFSLLLSISVLLLIYLWSSKIFKNSLLATLVTVITAFNPLFLQRAQIVNTDVFLLIGWLGYLLTFPRFWLSFFFLLLGVGSKSLLGFYPLIVLLVFTIYNVIRKKQNISSTQLDENASGTGGARGRVPDSAQERYSRVLTNNDRAYPFQHQTLERIQTNLSTVGNETRDGIWSIHYINKFNIRSLHFKIMAIQVGIFSLWYVLMFLVYKGYFLQVHFVDHLFKRITHSIESHFGKRTFYLDLVFEHDSFFSFIAILSLFILFIQWYKKRIEHKSFLMSVAFVPWFVFLNLTKTKISWYLYLVVPQIALLFVYPLSFIVNNTISKFEARNSKQIQNSKVGNSKHFGFLKFNYLNLFGIWKLRFRILVYSVVFISVGYLIYQALYVNSFFTTYYSTPDQNYHMALYAKKNCDSLYILVNKNDRETHDTLKRMNLLIFTSDWYANDPSTVYYFGKKVEFMYDKEKFIEKTSTAERDDCIVIYKNDLETLPSFSRLEPLQQFNSLYLYTQKLYE